MKSRLSEFFLSLSLSRREAKARERLIIRYLSRKICIDCASTRYQFLNRIALRRNNDYRQSVYACVYTYIEVGFLSGDLSERTSAYKTDGGEKVTCFNFA